MKNKIAATASLLLLLTLGAEVKGSCNDAVCSLGCVRSGYKNGGHCVGYPYDFCKCNPNMKGEATLGLEQDKVVTVEVKPKMLASAGRKSLRGSWGWPGELEGHA
ncbi:unnamed protein product [Urochloa decumbens]|uniref:Uncharacterized protein n=1 Tax=Urochloa decumbens TaxID=240449 RepID=A0ABC8VHX7_9POAL